VRCFGAFEVSAGGSAVAGLELRDSGRLIAFLSLRAGRMTPTIPIAEALWPDTGSLDSLHQSVRQCRLALGPDSFRLESKKGFLRLELAEAEADIVAFDRAIARGDQDSLGQAIDLHTAPLLEMWDDPWVRAERQKRRDQHLSALRSVAAASRESGDHAHAAFLLRRYLQVRRSEEWVWRELMSSLVAAGERLEALRLYEQARESLFKRMEPPVEMTRLAQQLRGDSASSNRQAAGGSEPYSASADQSLELGVPSGRGTEPESRDCPEPGEGVRSPQPETVYLVRPVDQRLSDAVSRLESVILVQGPAQSGKTSILARGLEQARQAGAGVAQIDLRKLGTEELESARSFYLALGYSLAEQLGVDELDPDTWNARRSPNANFESYVRRTVLAGLARPVVLGLDEVDRLFGRPFGMDVFALFRAWHNARSLDPAGPWKGLTLMLAYSTEASLFISDLNQSPFNVGVRVTLSDFSQEEVAELNRRLGSPLNSRADLDRYTGIVGGHPGLAHAGLRELASGAITLDDLARTATREDGPFGPHLRRMLSLLLRDATLGRAAKELITSAARPDEETFLRLRAAGVITGDSARTASVRCPLYAEYLEPRLP
jgi:DNA-binding SARP family transcriptional activator